MRHIFAACLVALLLGLPLCAQSSVAPCPQPPTGPPNPQQPAPPSAQQPAPASPQQPPLTGVVTFVEPDGQFYTTLGSVDQLYRHAQVQLYRDDQPIAMATIMKVNRLDSIGELSAQYQGFRLQTGDSLAVIANPAPSAPRKRLPYLEPNSSQCSGDALIIAASLLVLEQVLTH